MFRQAQHDKCCHTELVEVLSKTLFLAGFKG